MSYPHKLYLSFHSCGYRIMPEPEVDGAHAEQPHAVTAPCGSAEPESPEPKRISRFNWTGTADTSNPALVSPIEAYRERRRAGRRHAIGAFATLIVLIAFGVGAITLGVTQSDADALGKSNVFSTALPFFPSAEKTKAVAATSTPQQDWAQGKVPSLYQSDPQWSDKPYASSTLGTCGQAPLCMTMAYVSLTGSSDVLPTVAAETIEGAGFASNGATDSTFIKETAALFGLEATEVSPDESNIRKQLIAGRPIICVVGSGDFADGTSFVVLSGIDMDSKLVVHDPASEARSNRSWDFDAIIGQSESMWALRVPAASA